jgi:hypothetical protein
MKFICQLLLLLFLFTLSGCSTVALSDASELRINMIKVVNQSRSDVEDFRLVVPNTRGVVAANQILAGREFSNEVRPFPYQGNAVSLSWKHNGNSHASKVLKLDPLPPTTGVISVVLTFHEFGDLSVAFE